MEAFQSDYPLRYISLFSGIGGFEVGILRIFPNAICLGYSEIDLDAIKVYEQHFPDHKNLGDVTKLDARRFRGQVDLLVGGSPCQSFSMLGKRQGRKGKSKLVNEFIRILDECKPQYFILENVRMKQSHQDPISKILGETISWDGDLEPVMIDSNIVCAQRRKRNYWCNFDISPISDIDEFGQSLQHILLDENQIGDFPLMYKDLRREKTKMAKVLRDIEMGRRNSRSKYFTLIYPETKVAPTVETIYDQHHFVYLGNGYVRQLHPIEIERLQTFPDDWTAALGKSKRCKALGNAVTCDVIALIVSMLVGADNLTE